MNKSFKFCLSSINNAQKNSFLNGKLDKSFLNLMPFNVSYSNQSKNILRNRYQHRNKDGSFKEYNESITILPKEYEEQGNNCYFK